MSYSRITLYISIVLMVVSAVLFFTIGLNYGIDFKGGTLVQVQAKQGDVNIAQLRKVVNNLNLGDTQIQHFGNEQEAIIRIEQQIGGDNAQQQAIAVIKSALSDSYTFRRVEVVGPTISSELIYHGTLAVLIAILAILIYIWLRFEWQFGVCAVVTLTHDVILTIGVFSILQLEFTISVIAAILTIIGYSLNDTVVVYDRIRENLGKYLKMPLPELMNNAINKTLSRTLLTSLTTLLALFVLYIFGGEVLRGFSFAMIWGVIVGTYSSIFFASPLLEIIGIDTNTLIDEKKPSQYPF